MFIKQKYVLKFLDFFRKHFRIWVSIKHENGLYFLSRYSKDIHLAASHLHNFEINFKDIKMYLVK